MPIRVQELGKPPCGQNPALYAIYMCSYAFMPLLFGPIAYLLLCIHAMLLVVYSSCSYGVICLILCLCLMPSIPRRIACSQWYHMLYSSCFRALLALFSGGVGCFVLLSVASYALFILLLCIRRIVCSALNGIVLYSSCFRALLALFLVVWDASFLCLLLSAIRRIAVAPPSRYRPR
jgi:hypothetical protein